MSIESAKKFMERMKTDEEFAQKITDCNGKEARMEAVKAEGFDFTPEELVEVSSELGNDDLDQVAGGRTVTLGCNDAFLKAITPTCFTIFTS